MPNSGENPIDPTTPKSRLMLGFSLRNRGGVCLMDGPDVKQTWELPVAGAGWQVDSKALSDLIDEAAGGEKILVAVEAPSGIPKGGLPHVYQYGFKAGIIKGIAVYAGHEVAVVKSNEWQNLYGLDKDAPQSGHRKVVELYPEKEDLFKSNHPETSDAVFVALTGGLKKKIIGLGELR